MFIVNYFPYRIQSFNWKINNIRFVFEDVKIYLSYIYDSEFNIQIIIYYRINYPNDKNFHTQKFYKYIYKFFLKLFGNII